MFYPLSKITPNLYTPGNEYFIQSTQVDYKGYYYSTYDGRFFTEKTPSDTSTELLQYSKLINRAENMSASKYNSIANTTTPTLNTAQHTPQPTEADYVKEKFYRFLIKRVNGDASSIIELNKEDFTNISNNPLYNKASVLWFIKGNLESIYTKDGILIPGVVDKNFRSVKEAEKIIPGLSTYLKDLSQFHK